MAILEAIVEEASSLFQQIKLHAKYLLSRSERLIEGEGPPVLLISGHFPTDIHLTHLADFLASQGLNPLYGTYSYWHDLKRAEANIVSQLHQLYSQTGEKVSVLGYSKGGLIARSLAQNHPGLVDKVITLGTPHQGTFVALLDPSLLIIPSVKQMLPCSQYIRELNQQPLPPEVNFYSIYSLHDEMIVPNHSAILPAQPNVENIAVENTGHLGLAGEKTYFLLADLLRR